MASCCLLAWVLVVTTIVCMLCLSTGAISSMTAWKGKFTLAGASGGLRPSPLHQSFSTLLISCDVQWWTLYPAWGHKGSGASASLAVLSLKIVCSIRSCSKQAAFFLHRSVFLPVFSMVFCHHTCCVRCRSASLIGCRLARCAVLAPAHLQMPRNAPQQYRLHSICSSTAFQLVGSLFGVRAVVPRYVVPNVRPM